MLIAYLSKLFKLIAGAFRSIRVGFHKARIWRFKRRVLMNTYIKEDVKNEVILRCVDSCYKYKNSYFYSTILLYDESDTEGEQYKARGIEFEQMMDKRIRRFLANHTNIQYSYQWTLGRGRCDFALMWNDCKGDRHAVIIECKHSDSRYYDWKEQQISDGIQQLDRYAHVAHYRLGYQIDLAAVMVDFPIHGSFSMDVRYDVMIFNVTMLEEFLNGVIALKNKQRYVARKTTQLEAATLRH